MQNSEPEKLWASVVGDTEPWRKGRVLLAGIAIVNATAQALVFYAVLFTGALESAMVLAIGYVLWWLMFSFIWFGTHWLRWLLCTLSFLQGFAYVIWGVRDSAPAQLIGGCLSLAFGACLIAPAVHFFAVRQKSEIRWPEKLIVAAVFFLLAGSFGFALVGINSYRAGVQEEAKQYSQRALHRIFAENDTVFLLNEISDPFLQRYGRLGISDLMSRKYMRLGEVGTVHMTGSQIRSYYKFPATVTYAGVVNGEGSAQCGQVLLGLEILRSPEGWRINGLRWDCPRR